MRRATKIVSRVERPQTGRFLASSAFPRAVAQSIAQTRSRAILEALKAGLAARHISVPKQQQEVWRTTDFATLANAQKQNRRSGKERRF